MMKFVAALLVAFVSSGLIAQTTSAPIIIGETLTIKSKTLGELRTINVYLPPAYAEKNRKFPVLYLIDGGLDQDFMHIVGSAHLGAIWARSRSVIIVGVETKDRRRELVGPTSDPALLKQYPTAGSSAKFRAFLRDEVKLLIAAKYRVSGDDAVIGESLAGLFIVETYLREPSLFGGYAAISPSMWWDKEKLSTEAATLLSKSGQKTPPLYVNIANEGAEMQTGLDRLMAALAQKSSWCYAPKPALTHATIYHSTAPEALQFLFPTPVEQDPQSGFEIECAKQGQNMRPAGAEREASE